PIFVIILLPNKYVSRQPKGVTFDSRLLRLLIMPNSCELQNSACVQKQNRGILFRLYLHEYFYLTLRLPSFSFQDAVVNGFMFLPREMMRVPAQQMLLSRCCKPLWKKPVAWRTHLKSYYKGAPIIWKSRW